MTGQVSQPIEKFKRPKHLCWVFQCVRMKVYRICPQLSGLITQLHTKPVVATQILAIRR